MSLDSSAAAEAARKAMEAARLEVMDCEKEIQSVKTALRELGTGGDAEPNSLVVSALKVEGLPDAAQPHFKVQLTSPIEEIELTKLADPLDPEAEGTRARFEGVDTAAAMLTVTASDADIALGSSASHEVAPLCEFDPLTSGRKINATIDVAIVADGGDGVGAASDALSESKDLNEVFDASDNPVEDTPLPVVFAGPSGVGKGTLIEMLMKKFPDRFGFSVSHTTRSPREGEVDGVHYNFTTVDQIKKEIDDEKFIEYAEVHGRYYGTSISAVDTVKSSGKICVLDIDVQGVQLVKKTSLEPKYVFIAPPSMEALEARLRGRNTESEEDISKRLANAEAELKYGLEEGNFDRIFTNDDLDATFDKLVEQFLEWYPHLKSDGKKEVTIASAVLTPVCTVTVMAEFEPSNKDKKDGLYDLLNKASKRKATAIDLLRKSAAAVSRLSKDSLTKSDPRPKAVNAGFLNKNSKKEVGVLKKMYERTIGPNSFFRMVAPVAKNYVIFFGTAFLMHFRGQDLALPPPM